MKHMLDSHALQHPNDLMIPHYVHKMFHYSLNPLWHLLSCNCLETTFARVKKKNVVEFYPKLFIWGCLFMFILLPDRITIELGGDLGNVLRWRWLKINTPGVTLKCDALGRQKIF